MKDEFAVFIFLLCFYFGYLSAAVDGSNDGRVERIFSETRVLSKKIELRCQH
jgi:hypothetical protein